MLKDKYMTLSEVSKLKGFTTAHLRRMISNGKLKAEKVGYAWFIAQKDLKSLKRQRMKKD